MSLIFEARAISEVGLVREQNEDAGLLSPQLIAVADGMGGHVDGEVASAIAINTTGLLAKLISNATLDAESAEDLLMNLPLAINQELANYLESHPGASGMGTTLTALRIAGAGEAAQVQIVHVGDSRAYKWQESHLVALTTDHTVVQELVSAGRITAEEALSHPQRSLLTQALMGESDLDPMILSLPIKVGDFYLICSDGLCGVLSDYEMNAIIKDSLTAKIDVATALRDAVIAKGAPDNLTIIWAGVIEAEIPMAKSGGIKKREIKLLGAAK
jgi:serine/threonine protein phosphatase PrpC